MTWLLTRGRIPYLCLLLVATIWFGFNAAQLDVERNNESLNVPDDTLTATYERFQATFGSDEDLLLAVAHPQLLEPEGLRFVADLTARVARLDGVRHAYSLSNAPQLVSSDTGAQMVPLVPTPMEGPDVGARVRVALDRNPDFTGMFISADRRTAGILIEIEHRPHDHRYRAALIDTLRAIIDQESGSGVQLHLTGIVAQKHDVSAFIERDQRLLIPLAVVVLGALLATFFRRVLGVVLPLAVTGITVAWTLGAYHLAGLSLNAITALLPPVLMVLSLGVSVHIIQGWLEAPPGDPIARLRDVLRQLVFPCSFCTATTAIGFASLTTSPMPAVQQLGVFAAFGVIVAFVVGMTLVPVGLTFIAPPAGPSHAPSHRVMRRLLAWAAEIAIAHPWRILALFGVLTAVSLAGFPLIRNNTDLVRFLKSDARLYRDTMFIDTHLSGANTIELVVARRDGAPLTGLDDVRHMAALEQAILRLPHVTGVSSVLAVLRQLHRAEHGGEALRLPDHERDIGLAFDLLEASDNPHLVYKLIAPDFTRARFNVRIHAVGTAIAGPLVEAMLADGRRLFGDAYEVVATGAFHAVVQGSTQLVEAQVTSFSLAVVLVALAIGVLFRSPRLTLIALIPNVVPIIWTGGIMGAFGIDLSTGTAMIASAVIGIVVDDTIHYLTHFTRAYRGDPDTAVRIATNTVGTPLLINNLVLVLGFWVGCFGSFMPTIYFSLLSGITMITALVCDLFVTPACLKIMMPRRVVAA